MKPLAALTSSTMKLPCIRFFSLRSVASPARQTSGFDAFAADATFMVLDPAAGRSVCTSTCLISMEVMVHGEPVKLLLVQQNILTEDFRVTTSSSEGENYSPVFTTVASSRAMKHLWRRSRCIRRRTDGSVFRRSVGKCEHWPLYSSRCPIYGICGTG